MARLPDISDLIRAEKKSAGLQKKYEKLQREMLDHNKKHKLKYQNYLNHKRPE